MDGHPKRLLVNPAELARELAGRAWRLRDQVKDELLAGPDHTALATLHRACQARLAGSQDEDAFADVVAETLPCALVAARWLGDAHMADRGARFTITSAVEYLPQASKLVTALLAAIRHGERAGQPTGLRAVASEMAELLDAIDITGSFAGDDGKSASHAIFQFLEPFLAAYSKDVKNRRGVYFTPRPVVSYIVDSVHELVERELGLDGGLAATATWAEVLAARGERDLPAGAAADKPFVSILDFATGTGAFLVACIDVIKDALVKRWRAELGAGCDADARIAARWRAYVPRYLLPRLSGYESMMSAHAIAELALACKLAETGYVLAPGDRLALRLTDALAAPPSGPPFTAVIGNPPYSSSISEPAWLLAALTAWKQGLGETKSDLCREEWKFLRMAQLVCERTPYAVLGAILNRDFIDGIAKRRLRDSLQGTFAHRRVIDLNGDVLGNICDENVFDIAQGVAIAVLCRGGTPDHQVVSLQGTRKDKFRLLASKPELDARLVRFQPTPPYFRWIPPAGGAQAASVADEYAGWCSIADVFGVRSSGIQTKNDPVCIAWTASEIFDRVRFLARAAPSVAQKELGLNDSGAWSVSAAQSDLAAFGVAREHVRRILYRPFDWRFTYFTRRSGGFLGRPRFAVMRHMASGDNIGLLFNRQVVAGHDSPDGVSHFGVSRDLVCHGTFYLGNKGQDYLAPLYLLADGPGGPRPHNFTDRFLEVLARQLGPSAARLPPEAIFHYLYAVVHSPAYRTRYAGHLALDFPRVPVTPRPALFRALARLGGELASLHLFEAACLEEQALARYAGPDRPAIEKVSYARSSVWLDRKQTIGFTGVPEAVWRFRVGGYPVCAKWLAARRRRCLSAGEIGHYRRIVVCLHETIARMQAIDAAIAGHGGWPGAFATPLT